MVSLIRSIGTIEYLEDRRLLARRGVEVSEPAEPPTAPPAAEVQQLVQVALIGDSLSAGVSPEDAAEKGIEPRGSFRPHLWQQIREEDQFAGVQAVGTSTYNPGTLAATDDAHSAYRGFASYKFTLVDRGPVIGADPFGQLQPKRTSGWARFPSDVALVFVGMNDVLQGRTIDLDDNPRDSLEGSMRTIITHLRASQPDVQIFVGTLPEIDPARRFSHRIQDANTMIRELVTADDAWQGSTAESPIQIVDHATGEGDNPAYDLTQHAVDGVHPNAAGDRLLAANWWTALEPTLRKLTAAPTTAAAVDAIFASPLVGVQTERLRIRAAETLDLNLNIVGARTDPWQLQLTMGHVSNADGQYTELATHVVDVEADFEGQLQTSWTAPADTPHSGMLLVQIEASDTDAYQLSPQSVLFVGLDTPLRYARRAFGSRLI